MFRSAATKIAHNSTIPALAGNQDLRPLQDLITAEKAVIISLQKLSADLSKASEALKAWGLGEGDDLGNILSASTTILTHFTSALSQYASHGHTMREQLKAIRTREENLDELKRRRRGVMSKADSAERKLHKMNPENKNLVQQTDLLNRLREEIRGLDVDIMREDAAIGDFKRSATRSWMGLKFGGLLECCEKGVIAGEFGKLVVTEIPEDETQPGLPRNPYYGHSKVEDLVAETHRCANDVRLSTIPSAAQPRRIEQQLPQVPHVSESPFMNQGSFSSSPYQHQPHAPESYNDDGSKLDVLPEPQGFNTGRFIDSPVQGSPSPFARDQQPQYSGSLSSASAFQSPPGHRVDEFGSTIHTGPIDASNAGGGRFATFPVKGRSGSVGPTSGGGYPHRPDDNDHDHDAPLSLLSAPERGQSDSFSSSVAQALAASDVGEQQPLTEPPLGKPGRFSKDGPAPAYEPSIDSENPWTKSSPHAKLSPNDNQLTTAHSRQRSDLSGDEALLAYMSTPSTNVQGPTGGEVDDRHISRHVRFGTISEIDDGALPPMTPQESSFSPSPEPVGAAQTSVHRQAPEQGRRGSSDDQGDTREEHAPVAVGLQDHEKALNAAAAREIALELGSPSLTAHEPPSDNQVKPASGTDPSISPRGLPPSPLAPPTAPHMAPSDRKSVSPQPEFTAPAGTAVLDPGPVPSYTEDPLPIPHQYSGASAGYAPASVSPPMQQYPPSPYSPGQAPSHFSSDVPQQAQPYALQSSPLPHGVQGAQGGYGAQSAYEQEYNPYEEVSRQERPRGYSASGGVVSQSQISPQPPRINIPPAVTQSSPQQPQNAPGPYSYYNQPQGGESRGGGGVGGYEAKLSPTYHSSPPPEQPPNAPYMRSGMGNRSTSSLNSTGGGGGGKISAAAFKRPSPRIGGGVASPFGPPSPTPFSSSSARVSPTEGKRLQSPWDAENAPGYTQGQGQGQGVKPLKINKRHTQDLDVDQYDYISAYVNSGGPESRDSHGYDDGGAPEAYYSEQAQRAANANAGGGGWVGIGSGGGGPGGGGGYGQGRFATNLENESLK